MSNDNDQDDEQADLTTFNLVASTVMTLLGVFSLAYLIPDHIPVEEGAGQGLSARFMPTVAISAMTLLSFILGLNVFIRRVKGLGPLPEDNEDSDVQGFGIKDSASVALLLGGAVIYVGLLATVGFVISSALSLAACMYLGNVRNWLLIGLISFGIPLFLKHVLWWGLTIQLPTFSIFE